MSTQSLKPGWKMVKFGDIAQNVAVRMDPADAKTDVYVGLEHLDPSTLHLRQWGQPSDVTGQKLAFKKRDVIFGRRRAYQRKLAVAEFDGICSAHAMVVRAKPKMILPEFLPFFLQSDMFMERAIEISVGSLSPTINWKTLKVQEFPLPPLDEQKCIAEILWAGDEAREKWVFAISELLECHKVYAAKSLGSSEGKELSINDLGQSGEQVLKTGPFGSHLKTDYFQSAGVPIINISALGENGMDVSGFFYMSEKHAKKFESYMVREGDLVFSRVADIGRCLVIDEVHSGAIISSNLIRIRVDKNKIRPLYLYLLLKVAPSTRKQIMAITATGGRLLVNTKTMQNLKFDVPPIKVQDSILKQINKFSSTENLCSRHLVELETLQKKLLSGIVAN
jgi:type I restriction enzyme, S subunit